MSSWDPGQEERAFLMATTDLFEEWKAKEQAAGAAAERVAGLVRVYTNRFGGMPDRLEKAIAKVLEPLDPADFTGPNALADLRDATRARIVGEVHGLERRLGYSPMPPRPQNEEGLGSSPDLASHVS